jgi:hypothetical protein
MRDFLYLTSTLPGYGTPYEGLEIHQGVARM